jgi:hypothetical protein
MPLPGPVPMQMEGEIAGMSAIIRGVAGRGKGLYGDRVFP